VNIIQSIEKQIENYLHIDFAENNLKQMLKMWFSELKLRPRVNAILYKSLFLETDEINTSNSCL
jgi:hypothetical protein